MTEMVPAWLNGTLTPVEKLEVHRRGLRHRAVSVFVLDGPMMLLQRRALGKYHTPGLWTNTCCTHPRWGEDTALCAARRLREELGISGLDPRPAGQFEYRADVGGGLIEHELVDLFVAQVTGWLPMEPNPDEVMETQWVARDDLVRRVEAEPFRYTPWFRIYLDAGVDLAIPELLAR